MRPSSSQFIVAGYVILAAFLLLLNVVTDRSTIWAIWPIWALGAVTAGVVAIVRFPGIRLVAVWFGAGAVLAAGLFAIDLADGGNWWFFWPMAAWLVIGVVIAGLTLDLLGSVPTSYPAQNDDLAEISASPDRDSPSTTA